MAAFAMSLQGALERLQITWATYGPLATQLDVKPLR
jgi:hypothetical protein